MTTSNVGAKPLPIAGDGFPHTALIALLGGAAAIAFSPIFVRLSEAGPTATAFWRMALALPALWLITAKQESPPASQRPASGSNYQWLIAAGLCFAGDLATWHWALKYTTVANSVFLANLAPVFVTLGSWVLFRQRVSFTFILGMAVALAGATMLIGVSINLSLQNFWGDAIALVTAIFYGGYILCVKRARDNFSTATVMLWSGVVASLTLLPLTLLSGENFFPLTVWGWAVLAGLALFSHAGGQGLIAYALAHLSATFSSVTLLTQPIMSAFWAWLLLSETLGPWQAVGGAIVLAGIFVARQGSVR